MLICRKKIGYDNWGDPLPQFWEPFKKKCILSNFLCHNWGDPLIISERIFVFQHVHPLEIILFPSHYNMVFKIIWEKVGVDRIQKVDFLLIIIFALICWFQQYMKRWKHFVIQFILNSLTKSIKFSIKYVSFIVDIVRNSSRYWGSITEDTIIWKRIQSYERGYDSMRDDTRVLGSMSMNERIWGSMRVHMSMNERIWGIMRVHMSMNEKI